MSEPTEITFIVHSDDVELQALEVIADMRCNLDPGALGRISRYAADRWGKEDHQ